MDENRLNDKKYQDDDYTCEHSEDLDTIKHDQIDEEGTLYNISDMEEDKLQAYVPDIEEFNAIEDVEDIQYIEELEEESENENNEYNEYGSKRLLPLITMALVFSLIGGAIGSLVTMRSINYRDEGVRFDPTNLSTQEITINLNDNMYYVAAVAEKAQKWVVGVTTIYPSNSYGWPFGQSTQKAVGSGVIVNPNGYILTNSHVVGDGAAEGITVSLIDGTVTSAIILWNDKILDLAVIKIDAQNLASAEFGDSENLMIGEPVVAIGNPMTLDLERTVTDGIISGLNRTLQIDTKTVIKPLIQTNASINPGNSGGPLLNAQGKVIGINTAKMNSAEGLGFSIPINTAIPILEQIIDKGSVSSGYMGIQYISVSDYENRIGVDITPEYGIVVVEVLEDSPSQKAGLKSGDVIISLNGMKIEDRTDLTRKMYEYKAGDKIQITYLRDNNEETVELELANRPQR